MKKENDELQNKLEEAELDEAMQQNQFDDEFRRMATAIELDPFLYRFAFEQMTKLLDINTIYNNVLTTEAGFEASMKACRDLLGDTPLHLLFPEEDIRCTFERDDVDEAYWREISE